MVQLALPDNNGNPSAIYLLPKAFELTAQQIRQAPKQTFTLVLQGTHLALPKRGIFVVLTDLPEITERFVKDTVMLLPKSKLPRVAAIKVASAHTGHPRVVNLTDFIGLAIVSTAVQPVS